MGRQTSWLTYKIRVWRRQDKQKRNRISVILQLCNAEVILRNIRRLSATEHTDFYSYKHIHNFLHYAFGFNIVLTLDTTRGLNSPGPGSCLLCPRFTPSGLTGHVVLVIKSSSAHEQIQRNTIGLSSQDLPLLFSLVLEIEVHKGCWLAFLDLLRRQTSRVWDDRRLLCMPTHHLAWAKLW